MSTRCHMPITHHLRPGTRSVVYSPLCACKLKASNLREQGRGSSMLSRPDPSYRPEMLSSKHWIWGPHTCAPGVLPSTGCPCTLQCIRLLPFHVLGLHTHPG